MKYFTNLFVLLAWYLEKISDINATSTTQEEQIQKLRLSEKWKSDLIPRAEVMIALKINVLILTEKKIYNIKYSESTTRIFETEKNDKSLPTSIANAPDGVFGVPSYTITSTGKICQLDVSDPMKPRMNDFIEDSLIPSYSTHVWINKNEFIVQSPDGLLHVGNKNEGETKEWNSKKVKSDVINDTFLFQYDPKSFDILYARDRRIRIIMMWTEDEEGNPGDWQNEGHIRSESLAYGYFNFITSADVNNDGKTDLLFSKEIGKEHALDDWHIEIRAFEIPHSEEFKNPGQYKEHVLIIYLRGGDKQCMIHLKTFIPFVSYKGKQWILIGEYGCGEASYLQPENDKVGNWSYKRSKFFSSDDSIIRNIEVADIDQDGYTELYILADRLYVYSFSNRTITDPPSTSFICVVSVVIIVIIIVVVAFLLFKFGYLSRLADFFGY